MQKVLVEFPKLGLEFNVTREAFMIGDFAIYWYAILIAVGAILAIIYGISNAKKYGIDSDKLIDVAIFALVFGIIGARLYYVLFNIENYTSFADVINIRDGGLAIYGGLIVGIITGFIVCRINKTRFLPALDIAAGGFFIGQAIGRWGNFVNQEAFGVNTDSIFGMYSPSTESYLSSVGWDLFKQGIEVDPSKPVHPCFLYESLWCALGFLIILLYRKHRKFDGEIFLFYAAWYGTGRAFIEGLRTDSLMVGPFRVSQVLSIAAAVLAVAVIVVLRIKISKERKTNPDYLMLYADTKESKAQFAEAPEVLLEKAEVMLLEAENTLNDAEKNIKRLCGEAEASENLEELANELMTEEEVITLADKQLELVLTKISIATSIIDEIYEAEDLEATEEIDEDDDDYEAVAEAESKLDEIKQEIENTREYLNECFGLISTAREQLEKESEPEDEETEEDREAHEILDTVIDEGEEVSEASPNESK